MVIALSGPSGIGKGYFKESIMSRHPEVQEVVWYTTRNLRPNEKNRKQIPVNEFLDLAKTGKLVLVQNVFGHYYGVKEDDLLHETGIWLTEIHPNAMKEAKRINPKIISIGMLTEDISLLKERLTDRRKTESLAEIEERLNRAKMEMEAINDNPELFNKLIVINRDNEKLVASIAEEFYQGISRKR